MNTEQLLGNLPVTLRTELIDEFNKLVKNYRESRWEPTEMGGGKICEIAHSILKGYVDGVFPGRSSKPNNMVDACKDLERAPASFGRSVRIQIPRVIVGLYEIRNNRGAGHVGSDIDPSHMDATYVLATAKWIVSELVRLFNDVTTEAAQEAIELITEREVPLIWTVDGVKRVLDPSLKKAPQTLILLHQVGTASDKDLQSWIEYTSLSMYQKRILLPGHKDRLWEYNATTGKVTISSRGVAEAEKILG
ncbi:MAG TPA: hypothetical protein VIM37_01425 [Candidatus Microsaccharimonas sp.]|jgi:phage-related protein